MKDRLQCFQELASFWQEKLHGPDFEYDDYFTDSKFKPLETSTEIFFAKSFELQTLMRKASILISNLDKVQDKILTSSVVSEAQNAERNIILETIEKDTQIIHEEIKFLEREIESDRIMDNFPLLQIKMKENQYCALLMIFQDIVSEYYEVQMTHRANCHNR